MFIQTLFATPAIFRALLFIIFTLTIRILNASLITITKANSILLIMNKIQVFR